MTATVAPRPQCPVCHAAPGTLRATNPSTRTAHHIATIRQTIRRTP